MAKKRQKGKQPPAGTSTLPGSARPATGIETSREGLRSQLRRASVVGKPASLASLTRTVSDKKTATPVAARIAGKNEPEARDLKLWDHVAEQVMPLAGRRFLHHDKLQGPFVERSENPTALAREGNKDKSKRGLLQSPRPLLPLCQPAKPVASGLGHGQVAALDRRHGERLKRGRLGIDARIDLHGLYQADAHVALNDFIARSYAKGHRCLLVVTGKGLGQEEGGVLKRQTPFWLNQVPNRSKILAFDYAQPKDGGSGALYVLLKRQRS